MKKVLSTAAAFGLVLGMAASASALDLSVTGYYNFTGKMLSSANATGGAQLSSPTTNNGSAWFEDDFRIYPVLKVNDSISMIGDLRFASGRTLNAGTPGTIGVNKAYMSYASPIGKILMGRTPGGAWGSPFMNSATQADRIVWYPQVSKPWKVTTLMQKTVESQGGAAFNLGTATNNDTNNYLVGLQHASDMGTFDVAWWLSKNNAARSTVNSLWLNGVFNLGPANITAEFQYNTGDTGPTVNAATPSVASHTAMVMGTAKLADNLTAGAVWFKVSGDDDATPTKNESAMANGSGDDWEPFYIMTGDDMMILNNDNLALQSTGPGHSIADDGVQAFGVFADVAVSPKTALHVALGGGSAAKVGTGENSNYGWEADLGIAHKLLDNLTYNLHFGYYAVGDYVQAGTIKGNNIVLVTNNLKMTF